MSNPVSKALQAIDYDTFVVEPDGSRLPQSSAPAVIERLVRLLDVHLGHRVMEIGTGSGYTAALLSNLVGPSGKVVSIDVDPSLIARAAAKHAGTANLSLVAGDGWAGHSDGGPYDRIIAWTTPRVLPIRWLQQANTNAVVVTPVKVAPVAHANLTIRASVMDGEPRAASLHEGSFIDCVSTVKHNFALPAEYIDAAAELDGGQPAWLSSLALRGRKDDAQSLLDALLRSPQRRPHPVDGERNAQTAFTHYLYAMAGELLATAGLPTGLGYGLASATSIALLDGEGMTVAGSDHAADTLCGMWEAWERADRPALAALQSQFTRASDGWAVSVLWTDNERSS